MKIGFIATGDELTNGDVLNTNGQQMARTLFEEGYALGEHLLVSDHEADIVRAIHYMLGHHDVLIITGGLGPTSDDKTRFALATALHKSLVFDDASWETICERFKKFKLNIHESNKQQALFPEGSTIFPNPHGTANGCMIEHHQAMIFMLPGPPLECLSMFTQQVHPLLQEKIQTNLQNFKWRLFGISEGEIAAALDKLLEGFQCVTGYRWDYPYLEFKIRLMQEKNIEKLIRLIEDHISEHVICTPEKTASELLIEFLSGYQHRIVIYDRATHGLLEHILHIPTLKNKITFVFEKQKELQPALPYFEISGLDALWDHPAESSMGEFQIQCYHNTRSVQYVRQFPLISRKAVRYAVEYICYAILQFTQEIG